MPVVASSRQRPVGPAVVPSAQTRLAMPSCGPHFVGSHVAAFAVAGAGGSRQLDRSHFESLGHCESVVQLPVAGWQVQGPPQTSWPAQTTCSPALQFGVVQPHVRGSTVVPVVGSTVLSHGH